MKVLFVASGNSKKGISPILYNQGESLKKHGISIEYYLIKGKGLIGYLLNVVPLRKKLKTSKYEVVHAHFSLSAFAATLAGANPLVVSLMGSDIKAKYLFKLLVFFFAKFFWKSTIVKSEDMANSMRIKNVTIIPNGVDVEKFKPLQKHAALLQTGWGDRKRHILFAGNPNLPVKNYKLAKEAFDLVSSKELELHTLGDVPKKKMCYLYNSADIIILCSLYEGSPNVIKEAMACNRPIVYTDVGDVKENLEGEEGYFLVSYEPKDVAEKLKLALKYSEQKNQTNGRERVFELGLDSKTVAVRLINIYQSVIID